MVSQFSFLEELSTQKKKRHLADNTRLLWKPLAHDLFRPGVSKPVPVGPLSCIVYLQPLLNTSKLTNQGFQTYKKLPGKYARSGCS